MKKLDTDMTTEEKALTKKREKTSSSLSLMPSAAWLLPSVALFYTTTSRNIHCSP